jgi:hypothetical protein
MMLHRYCSTSAAWSITHWYIGTAIGKGIIYQGFKEIVPLDERGGGL